jgi:hypothetical protein
MEGIRRSNASPQHASGQQRRYYLVLVDKWTDKSLVAMVGRFYHNGAYADAIYLSAKDPSAAGWLLAVRAMQHDRVAGRGDKSGLTLVTRVYANGTQKYARGGKQAGQSIAKPVSAANVVAANGQLATLIPMVGNSAKHASKRSGQIQFLKM